MGVTAAWCEVHHEEAKIFFDVATAPNRIAVELDSGVLRRTPTAGGFALIHTVELSPSLGSTLPWCQTARVCPPAAPASPGGSCGRGRRLPPGSAPGRTAEAAARSARLQTRKKKTWQPSAGAGSQNTKSRCVDDREISKWLQLFCECDVYYFLFLWKSKDCWQLVTRVFFYEFRRTCVSFFPLSSFSPPNYPPPHTSSSSVFHSLPPVIFASLSSPPSARASLSVLRRSSEAFFFFGCERTHLILFNSSGAAWKRWLAIKPPSPSN